MTFSPSSGDIYTSLGIFLSCLFAHVFELSCGELLETFVFLPLYDIAHIAKVFNSTMPAVLLPIKS